MTIKLKKYASKQKLAYFGGDDLIGGLVGHSSGQAQKERGEAYSFGVPGGAGYQIGRYLAHHDGTKKGKRKKASAAVDWAKRNKDSLIHGAEVAGLGVLAKSSWDALRKKRTPEEAQSPEAQTERRHAKYEMAGLGILAAHPAMALAKKVMTKTSSADIRLHADRMFGREAYVEKLAAAWLEKHATGPASIFDQVRKPLVPAAARVAAGARQATQTVSRATTASKVLARRPGTGTGLDRLRAIRLEHPGGSLAPAPGAGLRAQDFTR